MSRRVLRRLRRPEHTGENRCLPCTLLNLGLLGLVSAGVATVSIPAAVLCVALGGAAVALRGYLVPYTPRFAPRLVAGLPVDVGHGAPAESDAPDPETDGEAVLDSLLDAGALTGGDGLALTDGFRAAWTDRMARVRGEDVGAALRDARPDVASVARRDEDGETWFVLTGDPEDPASEAWVSRPVAVADVAAHRELRDRGVGPDPALGALAPLRQFLPHCPVCEGELTVRAAREDCCGGFGPAGPRRGLACADCDAWLGELPDE